MAAQEEGNGAPALRGELETTGGTHGGTLHLADHRAEAAVAQPLLHQREQLGIVACLGIEDALGREAGLVETGRKQVAPADNPEYRAPGARSDSGDEQGGGGIVAQVRGAGGNFVQRIEPEAAIGDPLVERGDAERQCLTPAITVALDGAERFA
ncbi:hypothetical protein SAMN05428950_102151 [Sphingomonas sp. OV641]|nr:hypothetical protein SAMN05428950_102151 [Sphingomonas sp. OV641]